MLKIRTILSPILQKILLGLTLILSVFTFSGSASTSSNFHQAPQQSELLYSFHQKRRSSIFSFSRVLKTEPQFFLNHLKLEKVRQFLFSVLSKILLLVLISQLLLKETRVKFFIRKMLSLDSEDPNLIFSLG